MTDPFPDDRDEFEWRLVRVAKSAKPRPPQHSGLSSLIALLLSIAICAYFFAFLINR